VGIGTQTARFALEVNTYGGSGTNDWQRDTTLANFVYRSGTGTGGRSVDFQLDYRGRTMGDGNLVFNEARAGRDFLVVNMLTTGTTANRVVFPNGNIGIGQNSPAEKLDVSGTILSRGVNAPTTGVGVEIDYGGIANTGRIFAYDRDASAYKPLRLGNGFDVLANGDINGIGGATFAGLFTANNRAMINGNVANQEAMVVTQKVAGTIAEFRDMAVGSSKTRFLIKNGGNVGIDTNDADTKLLVKGDVRLTDGTNGFMTLRGNDMGTQIVTGKKLGGERDLQFLDRNASNVETELMRLTSDGKLGIGVRPQATLDVAGRAKILGKTDGQEALIVDIDQAHPSPIIADFRINTSGSQFTVKSNGDADLKGSLTVAAINTKVWSIAPDYVFEKDYKLAPLEHVERYLDENKHLPEIPSAKEIKEKGLDLAEMNLKLLKKVEELTLYSIKQNHEIENLKTRLERVEGEPSTRPKYYPY
jgi:hypothetical protein